MIAKVLSIAIICCNSFLLFPIPIQNNNLVKEEIILRPPVGCEVVILLDDPEATLYHGEIISYSEDLDFLILLDTQGDEHIIFIENMSFIRRIRDG